MRVIFNCPLDKSYKVVEISNFTYTKSIGKAFIETVGSLGTFTVDMDFNTFQEYALTLYHSGSIDLRNYNVESVDLLQRRLFNEDEEPYEEE